MIQDICGSICMVVFLMGLASLFILIILPTKIRCVCPECGCLIQVTRLETYKEVQTLFTCTSCYYRVLAIEKVEKRGPID